ncbi:MAG: SDR family NAD(P)-dependent oxidoreductase [Chitinophagaceae bacterium]
MSPQKGTLIRVAQICSQHTPEVLVVPMDVTQEMSRRSAIDTIRDRFGQVDMLIHGAGISQRSRALETLESVDRLIMETNYFGPVLLTKMAWPLMKENHAHLVILSSIAGKFGFYNRSAYSASKHALHGFFESLRFEMNHKNLRVTLVCPGYIRTPISLHALTANGEIHGKMDATQLNGLPVEQCAAIIIRAIQKNKKEVYMGKKELILWYLKRISPAFFYFLGGKLDPGRTIQKDPNP